MEEKSIYVLFLTTQTGVGKIIRAVTKYKYNHCSFSMDKYLNKMYSFSRYKKNVPLVGGFTQESKLRYAGDEQVKIKVCEVKLSKEKYQEIKAYINELQQNNGEYLYNIFSAVTFPMRKKVNIKNAYICVEFVIHLISKFNLVEGISEENFYTIQEFDKIMSSKCIYEGTFDEYIKSANKWDKDDYAQEEGIAEATIDTIKQVGKLIKKSIED